MCLASPVALHTHNTHTTQRVRAHTLNPTRPRGGCDARVEQPCDWCADPRAVQRQLQHLEVKDALTGSIAAAIAARMQGGGGGSGGQRRNTQQHDGEGGEAEGQGQQGGEEESEEEGGATGAAASGGLGFGGRGGLGRMGQAGPIPCNLGFAAGRRRGRYCGSCRAGRFRQAPCVLGLPEPPQEFRVLMRACTMPAQPPSVHVCARACVSCVCARVCVLCVLCMCMCCACACARAVTPPSLVRRSGAATACRRPACTAWLGCGRLVPGCRLRQQQHHHQRRGPAASATVWPSRRNQPRRRRCCRRRGRRATIRRAAAAAGIPLTACHCQAAAARSGGAGERGGWRAQLLQCRAGSAAAVGPAARAPRWFGGAADGGCGCGCGSRALSKAGTSSSRSVCSRPGPRRGCSLPAAAEAGQGPRGRCLQDAPHARARSPAPQAALRPWRRQPLEGEPPRRRPRPWAVLLPTAAAAAPIFGRSGSGRRAAASTARAPCLWARQGRGADGRS